MTLFSVVWCPFLFSNKGDKIMNPSLRDQLKEWQKLHPESAPKKTKENVPPQKPKKAKSESLSESDIRNLMNTNMRTLRRKKGGAWK
ncbi:hypothetical protein ABE096_14020 [Robertmurraya massiliosenegalensis]|uniref:hypothetical protein n=1 Tax=Robertmurraya TaxID=2837507 RepID=UPI0039A5CD98